VTDRIHPVHSWSLSEEVEDSEWNRYLEQHPCGQFQQSTVWASVKAAEGWSVLRIKLFREGKLAGGAQILCRKSPVGRIGYVAKGPVVTGDSDMREMLARVQAVARDRSIQALIVQAPDFWQGDPGVFLDNGGQHECLMDIIQATLSVDLARPVEMIRSEMRSETRRQIKLAEHGGITIREAGESEIDLFFDLMLESCRRQQVHPNPASAQGLKDLWSAFGGHRGARLTFAVAEDEVIAGLFSMVFGNRLTLWRKGWHDAYRGLNPNRLLYSETIEWGCRQGLKWCDFVSLNRAVADALIGGHPMPSEGVRGRDAFHLSFGGKPFLLPLPYIFFSKPALRLAYRAGVASGVAGWLKRNRTKRPSTRTQEQ
jgi:lipid II:glycine glycyltransferase (peptidoglycan interpeptide bridge formation enzyme)